MTMFQRLFRRSGIELCYSQGYNPRPKLSLPLPRSVGIASDAELLCVSVQPGPSTESAETMTDTIRSQMPDGCTLTELSIVDSKVSFKPRTVVYEFPIADPASADNIEERLADIIRQIKDSTPVYIERTATKKRPSRRVDVAPYIESAELSKNALHVKCNITPAGTVRIDEILHLLDIDTEDINGPITRKSVEWAD